MDKNKKKLAIVCLSYPKDYERALMSLEVFFKQYEKCKHAFSGLEELTWKDVHLVIESKHKDVKFPRDVTVVVEEFYRDNHTKKTTQEIFGLLRVFVRILYSGYDALFYVESDTFIFEPAAFIAPWFFSTCDFVGVQNGKTDRLGCHGNAVLFSKRAIATIVNKNLLRKHKEQCEKFKWVWDYTLSYLVGTQWGLNVCWLSENVEFWKGWQQYGENVLLAHTGLLPVEEAVNAAKKFLGYDVSKVDGLEQLKEDVKAFTEDSDLETEETDDSTKNLQK